MHIYINVFHFCLVLLEARWDLYAHQIFLNKSTIMQTKKIAKLANHQTEYLHDGYTNKQCNRIKIFIPALQNFWNVYDLRLNI